jgi:shikimate dehydrogenase
MKSNNSISKKTFGLIGKKLTHSFSKGYFANKFKKSNMKGFDYVNFELDNISEFPELLKKDITIAGFNVTIPYKEAIIPYLDKVSKKAKEIGAINTIAIRNGELIGYNTDVYGFENSLAKTMSWKVLDHALILGTGGASKAIQYVLEDLGISYNLISRNKSEKTLTYDELDKQIIKKVQLIVNTTPLGMHPNIDDAPNIPYQYLGPEHLLYDLIYNPEKSLFLKMGEEKGAMIKNGYDMLVLQADRSWQIWNEDK